MRLVADQGVAIGKKGKITAWYRKKDNPPRVPMDREQVRLRILFRSLLFR